MKTVKTRSPMFVPALAAMLIAMPLAAATDTPQNPDATVVVRNFNSLDVQVFAVTEAGRRFELGTVNRNTERTFALPDRLISNNTPFRLKIYSIARTIQRSLFDKYVAGIKTQLLSPADGDEIRLDVMSPLVSSLIDHGPETAR